MKKFLIFFIIPVVLLLFWIGASTFTWSKPYLVITTNHYALLNKWVGRELLKGDVLQSTFTSNNDNMGTVDIRFFNFNRISNDSVIFRIKEKHAKNWYYINTYKVNQFQPNNFFTFGFPALEHSKGKTYVFNIESISGKHVNAITISSISPQVMSLYQVQKSELKNPRFLIYFVGKKLSSIFSDQQIFVSSFVFLIPLLVYICILLVIFNRKHGEFLKKIILHSRPATSIIEFSKKHKSLQQYSFSHIFFFLFFLFIFLDLFFLQINSIIFVLCLYVLWFLILRIRHLDSSISFIFALFCLLFHIVFLLAKNETVATNFSTWFDIFFITGLVQLFLQQKNTKQKYITFGEWVKTLKSN